MTIYVSEKIAAMTLVITMCFTAIVTAAPAAQAYFKPDTMVEAESGSIKSNMVISSDEYSSGGRFITSIAVGAADAAKINVDDASYLFEIEKNQTYTLYARVYVPSGTPAFYLRWDRENWELFDGSKNDNYQWLKLGEFELKKGTRKFQISRKTAMADFDCFYLSSDPEAAPPEIDGVKERDPSTGKNLESPRQKQTKELKCVDGAGVFEVEDATLSQATSIITPKNVSGSAVKADKEAATRNTPDPGDGGYIELEFIPDMTAKYTVWARVDAPSGGNDSCFVKLGNEANYKDMELISEKGYVWIRFGAISCKEGVAETISIRPREAGWGIDQIIVVNKLTYVPDGIVKEVELGAKVPLLVPDGALPPYNPPANEHPRVYFRKSDIPKILENMEHPENAYAKETLLSDVEKPIEVGTKYSDGIMRQMTYKAFYYQLYGDKDKGREAIEAVFKLADWDNMGAVLDYTRRYGACIETIGIIYDWCYDLLTDSEKNELISMAVSFATPMEIGWPPNKQGSLVGHGAEAQLLRDDMAFAIATYDERPDFWNYIGGRFYEMFVPERQWHLESQLNHQGSNYGPYRNLYSAYGYLLITGMGLPEPYSGYLVGTNLYSSNIYGRRPDGTMFLDGDDWTSTPMSYNEGSVENALVECACSKDPLVKDELVRLSRTASGNFVYFNSGIGAVKWILFNQPQVERASRESMPLSYYFKSPMGVMYARTGWQEGVDSPAVVAEMKVGEYWFGNHQHKDSGSFQIYYKGPLATESGFYQQGSSYGWDDHTNYTMQTIAHNCMLVYDPSEPKIDFAGRYVNDGGQRWPSGIMQTNYNYILNDPQHHRATVEGEEIDPQNPMTPEYTYLKGDLTNAYSDKISDYKRSFMFLNLEEEGIPAALIIFDKLTVSNPSFEKTWVMHGQQNPEIKGSRLIWKSNPYVDKTTGETYKGKMVQDSLLPAANVEMKIASGPEIGWNNVRGTDFTHPDKSPDKEENTYRLEVSPTDGKATDYFLNVLQVTDEGNNEYYSARLLQTNEMYGVKIKDRVVMFSKSGKKLGNVLELESSPDNLKYMICDMNAGTYKITADGAEQTAKVSENGGVLSFSAAGRNIRIEKSSDEAAVNEEIRKPGKEQTFIIKVDKANALLPGGVEIVNDKLMVSAEELSRKIKCIRDKQFLKEVYKDDEQQIKVIFRPDSNIMNVNGQDVEMTNKAYYKDGKLMVELRAFAEAFNYIVNWDDLSNGVLLVGDRKVKLKTTEGYANAINAENDDGLVDAANIARNAIDGALTTLWSAEGKGRYMTIELDKETVLENVEIVFNPNSRRTPAFEIHISNDGQTYEKVYEGFGSPDADGLNWEVHKFDPNKYIKTKYIRYVANGSDKSLWNGVKDMRFKIGEEMEKWDMTDEYVKIVNATPDAEPADGDNVASNLIDSNSRTIWAAQGFGRYVDLELESETEISGLDIVFNPNSNRTAKFSVSVSTDGKEFTKIFEGKSNPDSEKNTWESFEFGNKVKAKYVRYTGNGSNISLWNGVNEIRVKK